MFSSSHLTNGSPQFPPLNRKPPGIAKLPFISLAFAINAAVSFSVVFQLKRHLLFQ
jgi:hypothetical protein